MIARESPTLLMHIFRPQKRIEMEVVPDKETSKVELSMSYRQGRGRERVNDGEREGDITNWFTER
jgi:hypothetical protein